MTPNEILDAYELGLADGYYAGVEANPYHHPIVNMDELRAIYRRGYDRGVAMFCDTIEDDEPTGPCLCGRGECPECGNG